MALSHHDYREGALPLAGNHPRVFHTLAACERTCCFCSLARHEPLPQRCRAVWVKSSPTFLPRDSPHFGPVTASMAKAAGGYPLRESRCCRRRHRTLVRIDLVESHAIRFSHDALGSFTFVFEQSEARCRHRTSEFFPTSVRRSRSRTIQQQR